MSNYLEINPLVKSRSHGGIGQFEILASLVSPLAQAGADVFQSYNEGKQSKAELKQRQREFQTYSTIYQQQMASHEKREAIAQVVAAQQAKLRARYQSEWLPYVTGVVVIGGLVLVALASLRD